MRTATRFTLTLALALAGALVLGTGGTALAGASDQAHCLGALSSAVEPGTRDDTQLFHNALAETVFGVPPGTLFVLTFGRAHGTPADCSARIPGDLPVPPQHPNK